MGRKGLVLVAVGVFVFLCCWNVFVAGKMCWFDEAFTIETIHKGVSTIDFASYDVHPPVYYLLLAGWMKVQPAFIGQCDWGRMLSVVFGCIFLIAVFFGARRFLGDVQSGIVVVLCAMTPTFIHFGSEARMYMLLIALVAVAWAMLLRSEKWGPVVATSVLFFLPFIQYYAVLAVVPLVLSYVVLCDVDRRQTLGVISSLLIATIAGALLSFALFALPQIHRSEGMWFGRSTLSSLSSAVSYAFFPPQYDLVGSVPMAISILTLIGIGVGVVWALFGKKDSDVKWLLWIGLAMIVVPAVVLLAVPIVNMITGFQFGNIYHHRVVLVATWLIPVAVYVAFVSKVWKYVWAKFAVGILVAVLLLLFLVYVGSEFSGVQTGHKELRGAIAAVPCDGLPIIHESPFSALPALVVLRDQGCIHRNIVVTNLTEVQGRTSGFDVIPKENVVYAVGANWSDGLPNVAYYFKSSGLVDSVYVDSWVLHVEDGLNLTTVVR